MFVTRVFYILEIDKEVIYRGGHDLFVRTFTLHLQVVESLDDASVLGRNVCVCTLLSHIVK